ncbi:hypothetical protein GCM10009530_08550 [Microbispora corallina]|uniref:Phytanoyl-CoA dioxygenase family protein n=1 Tax=Microbispora corallina TaxID=83302 RepID=A0ABQ4FVH9_9ACTN|nr:hypothetical protein [Microbispora corallina]GIH38818.1 hypothetical protein Mco01_18180 [Microbispora corallina]
MTALFSNSGADDDARRRTIYEGGIFVYSATPASVELIGFARALIEEAFQGLDPETAQFELPVEDYVALLADLKPRFIHHPECARLLPLVLAEAGCALDRTYFDVPRLRTSTSDEYLTSGISYAYHAHRDCWYSAPFNQVNWWMPIYPVSADNVMAFHTQYFARPVANGSERYDYADWTAVGRPTAAAHVHSDTREQPRPEEVIELEPQLRVVPEPGGFLMFSGAHLHSTVPNTSGRTRFSIDFRTVNIDDVRARLGAPNVDARCAGTTLRDFRRAADLTPMPSELAEEYEAEALARVR